MQRRVEDKSNCDMKYPAFLCTHLKLSNHRMVVAFFLWGHFFGISELPYNLQMISCGGSIETFTPIEI
jgi:hypothetical protein